MVSVLAALLNRDRLDESVFTRLTSCNLSGIPKKNPLKLRPIAVGEAFYKVLGTYTLTQIEDEIKTHFGDLQLGVKTPGGAERIVHEIRSMLTDDSILCTIDAKNAFNAVLRSSLKDRLTSDPQWSSLYTMFNTAYASASNLHYTPGHDDDPSVIKSTRGTRQGDPLGAFFFCLVIHPALVAARARFANTDIIIRAYMDDITLHSPSGDKKSIIECFKFLEEQLSGCGLDLEHTKCEWFSFLKSKPDSSLGFDFKDRAKGDTIRVLGGYFGNDDAVRQVLKQDVVDPLVEFFDSILAVDGQEALLLISQTMIPRIGFILRAHPPELTGYVAAEFDALTRRALEHLGELKVTTLIDEIRGLPTKFGGLGWTRATDIRNLAYDASRTFAEIPLTLSKAEYATRVAAIASQKTLTEEYHHRTLLRICQEHPHMRALLSDNGGFGASSWLHDLPEWTYSLDPALSAAALRSRLGAAHLCLTDTELGSCYTCPCGVQKKSASELSAHLSGCTKIIGNNSSASHKTFKQMFKDILYYCSVQYEENEPTFDLLCCPECNMTISCADAAVHVASCKGKFQSGQHTVTIDALRKAELQRPDIRFFVEDGMKVVVDLSLTSRTHTDHEELRKNKELDAHTILNDICDKKDNKYKNAVEANGEKFIPVIATSNGTISTNTADMCFAISDNRNGEFLSASGVRAAIAYSAVHCRALALYNGEKKMGVVHRAQPRAATLQANRSTPPNPVTEALANPTVAPRLAAEPIQPAPEPAGPYGFFDLHHNLSTTDGPVDHEVAPAPPTPGFFDLHHNSSTSTAVSVDTPVATAAPPSSSSTSVACDPTSTSIPALSSADASHHATDFNDNNAPQPPLYSDNRDYALAFDRGVAASAASSRTPTVAAPVPSPTVVTGNPPAIPAAAPTPAVSTTQKTSMYPSWLPSWRSGAPRQQPPSSQPAANSSKNSPPRRPPSFHVRGPKNASSAQHHHSTSTHTCTAISPYIRDPNVDFSIRSRLLVKYFIFGDILAPLVASSLWNSISKSLTSPPTDAVTLRTKWDLALRFGTIFVSQWYNVDPDLLSSIRTISTVGSHIISRYISQPVHLQSDAPLKITTFPQARQLQLLATGLGAVLWFLSAPAERAHFIWDQLSLEILLLVTAQAIFNYHALKNWWTAIDAGDHINISKPRFFNPFNLVSTPLKLLWTAAGIIGESLRWIFWDSFPTITNFVKLDPEQPPSFTVLSALVKLSSDPAALSAYRAELLAATTKLLWTCFRLYACLTLGISSIPGVILGYTGGPRRSLLSLFINMPQNTIPSGNPIVDGIKSGWSYVTWSALSTPCAIGHILATLSSFLSCLSGIFYLSWPQLLAATVGLVIGTLALVFATRMLRALWNSSTRELLIFFGFATTVVSSIASYSVLSIAQTTGDVAKEMLKNPVAATMIANELQGKFDGQPLSRLMQTWAAAGPSLPTVIKAATALMNPTAASLAAAIEHGTAPSGAGNN
jgi:hypothetical protein